MDLEAFRSGLDTVAEQCIGSRLRVVNRFVTNIYDEALRPLGLKVGQLNLLVAIAKIGEAQTGLLREIFHMDASTLSRNVDRMRRRGWITASPGEDGRTVLLSLTQPGEELLQRAMIAWKPAQERAIELLGQEGVSMLHELTLSLGSIDSET